MYCWKQVHTVFAFDVPGGIAEIITNEENGFLVEDNDLIAFAVAVKKALTADFNRDSIREQTKKRFSVNVVIEESEYLFLKLHQNK